MNEAIDFNITNKDDVTVFTLNEEKFDAEIAGLVKGELTILLQTEDVHKLVIDLSSVDYCDSSGLSAILLAFRILQSNNGKIFLVAPNGNVKSLIEISQLNRILPVSDSVESAIEKLN